MRPNRPQVLLLTSLDTRFSRGIFEGMVNYARHRTNWRLVCQVESRLSARRPVHVDGILSLAGEVPELAKISGVPFVMMGDPIDYSQASSVAIDETGVGAMAAEHFASLGLTQFAYVGHGPWPFVQVRLNAFAKAVAAMGHGPIHQLIGSLFDRRRRARFERDIAAMFRNLPRPCGLLAANDELGVLIVEICLSLGLRVPEDIAILGVDDDEMACELSEVPLSSVRQPLFAIGYEAARLLHQHIEQPDKQPTRLLLPPVRVVARASSDMLALEDAEVVAALRLIKDRATEPINVAWIVNQLPVARRSLETRFKAVVGRTLLEQIHHVRFQKAKELLAETELSLELVARRSGFANARWMADSFRRELGITPGRYRSQLRAGGS